MPRTANSDLLDRRSKLIISALKDSLDPLTVDAIAEKLSTSYYPVYSSLRKLVADGLVTKSPFPEGKKERYELVSKSDMPLIRVGPRVQTILEFWKSLDPDALKSPTGQAAAIPYYAVFSLIQWACRFRDNSSDTDPAELNSIRSDLKLYLSRLEASTTLVKDLINADMWTPEDLARIVSDEISRSEAERKMQGAINFINNSHGFLQARG